MKKFNNATLQNFFNDVVENNDNIKINLNVLYRLEEIDDSALTCYDGNIDELKNLILKYEPNTKAKIGVILYVLRTYADWLKSSNIVLDYRLYQDLHKISRDDLWEIAKLNKRKKYFSYNEYQDIISKINNDKEKNPNYLYCICLLQCIYEGVYDKNLNVFKNLRLSDIDEKTCEINLYDDNSHYKLKVSDDLIQNLIKLEEVNEWIATSEVNMTDKRLVMKGKFAKSIFKTTIRDVFDEDSRKYYAFYYIRIKKMFKKYLGYKISPYQLFISGLMHRIKPLLEAEGFELKEAFNFTRGNEKIKINMIIQKEIERCHGGLSASELRQLVETHIDNFED